MDTGHEDRLAAHESTRLKQRAGENRSSEESRDKNRPQRFVSKTPHKGALMRLESDSGAVCALGGVVAGERPAGSSTAPLPGGTPPGETHWWDSLV